MNDNELKITYNIVKLLRLAALAAILIGLLYAILSCVGLGSFASGSAKAGQFFLGMLQTLFVSGILAGLSEYLLLRRRS